VNCQYLFSFYQAVYVTWFTHRNDIVRDHVCRDSTILVMEVMQVLATFGSLEIEAARVLIYPFDLHSRPPIPHFIFSTLIPLSGILIW